MRKINQERVILRRILRYVKNYTVLLVFSILLAAVYVASSLLIPILVGYSIDQMIGAGQVSFEAIARILIQIGLCAGIGGLSHWVMGQLNNHVTYRITRDVRRQVFSHIQHLPLSYLDGHAKGDIVSRVVTDVDTFADGLLMGFTQLFTGVITILGTLVLMLSISWQIALVVICVTPLSLVVASFIAKSTYSMFQEQTKTRGEQTAFIDETITNLKLVQAFGHGKASLDSFNSVNNKLEKCSLKAIFFSSMTNPSTRFVNSLVYAGVALTGGLVALSNPAFTVGYLTSFLNYANQYTKPFNEISGVVTELQNAIACAGRVFELMDVPPIQEEATEVLPETVAGNMEIHNLSFRYDPQKPLIEDFNLTVKPGQKIAIVGPTGCGKTTFINLLMRFYDPNHGEIVLDGVLTNKVARKELRHCIGMVLQDTWLKSGTIHENISMGRPDATRQEVMEAARKAHAHSFIKRLPDGYDTVIQEHGDNLSQGQRQLLCIARVMLCLPPMLILDEATSSIDTRTEHQIQKAFDLMMQGRTCFVVAHRLSTIQEADCILVMKDGHIIEQGDHSQLLARKGFYADLYNSQFAH